MQVKNQRLMLKIVAKISATYILASGTAWAQELPRDWTSLRYAGLGFASVSLSNDSESGFSNPAGLARIRNPRSRYVHHETQFPRFSVSGPETQLTNIMNNVFSTPSTATSQSLAEAASKTENHETHIEASMFPTMVLGGKSKPTFLFGFYGNSQFNFKNHKGTEKGVIDYTRDTTMGVSLGIAASSKTGTFAYGLSIRPNMRYFEKVEDFNSNTQTIPTLAKNVTELAKTSAIGIDAGFLYTAADFWLPTFGLAIRNAPLGCSESAVSPFTKKQETVCGSNRSGTQVTGENRTLVDAMELKAGFSITPRFRVGKDKFNLRISAEASPINIPTGGKNYGYSEVPLEQMLKAGVEFLMGHPQRPSDFAVRTGVYNSELTWGATLTLWFLQLEYASYSKQSSFDNDSNLKTRQHLVGLSGRF